MDVTTTHPFDEAVALEPVSDGRLRGRTSDLYWNMISPFGGATAATALNGILMHPDRFGDPISLTVNFVAPLQAGEFFVITRLVRSNRSTQHWAVEIVQGEQEAVAISAIAFFGTRRSTWSMTEAVPPSVPERDNTVRFQPHSTMRWPEMYDVRYARGLSREGGTDSITHGWISDATPRSVDFLALAAYCDTFAPRLFLRRPVFVPIGTVSLNVYYHADADELAMHGAAPVLGVAHGQVIHKGYFDQQAQIWGRENKLLATSHQIVWFKE